MTSLNLSYTYDFQRKRLQKAWDDPLPLKKELITLDLKNAILLPPKPDGNGFGTGCILDENMEEIDASRMYWGNKMAMGGKYNVDVGNLEKLSGNYVYLGFINNWYGHLFQDFSSRLYSIRNHPEFIPLFFITNNNSKWQPGKATRRFLELAGVNLDRILFIDKPKIVEHIVVPEASYISNLYYTTEYVDTFDAITSRIDPDLDNSPEKCYFSRTTYTNINKKEFGNELLDTLFADMGYHVIIPEQETLDNQICYLKNASSLAMVQGTLVHALTYCDCSQKYICIVNKTYTIETQMLDALKIRKANPIFCDFYVNKYPTSISKGPFIFVKNKNMDNFIKGQHIQAINSRFYSDSYKKKSLTNYDFQILRFRKIYHEFSRISNNIYDMHCYWPPEMSAIWVNEYLPLIIADMDNIRDFTSINEIIQSNKLIKNMLNNLQAREDRTNVLVYSVHLSNIGWLAPVFSDHIGGSVINHQKIEAFRLSFLCSNIHIYYAVYYIDTGWDKECRDGAIAGSTGKCRKIHGLKIWLEENWAANYSVEYRLFTNVWLDWCGDGQEIIDENGFSAMEIRIAPKQFSNTTTTKITGTALHLDVAQAAGPSESSSRMESNESEAILPLPPEVTSQNNTVLTPLEKLATVLEKISHGRNIYPPCVSVFLNDPQILPADSQIVICKAAKRIIIRPCNANVKA